MKKLYSEKIEKTRDNKIIGLNSEKIILLRNKIIKVFMLK